MTDSHENAPPSKRPRTEQQTSSGPKLKNVVEIDGKACTHEVSWPPGGFIVMLICLNWPAVAQLKLCLQFAQFSRNERKFVLNIYIYRNYSIHL